MSMTLFIKPLIEGDVESVKYWALAIGIMALLVIMSSLVDLGWGIRASKACGNFKTTSYGLKKTVEKLVSYLSFFFLGVMIDACLGFFTPFPFACIIVAVAEILIETVSVYENRKRSKIGGEDPINVVKAVAKTFGITDAEKIKEILEMIKEEREIQHGGK